MKLNERVENELCGLCIAKSAASDAYNAACKEKAAEIAIAPAVLKKYIAAKLRGDTDVLLTEAEQLEALANGGDDDE